MWYKRVCVEEVESVMCDVIKIRLKRRDESRSCKGNPQKRDELKRIFMTLHSTLSSNFYVHSDLKWLNRSLIIRGNVWGRSGEG